MKVCSLIKTIVLLPLPVILSGAGRSLAHLNTVIGE